MTIFLHPPPYLGTKLRGLALHIWGVHDYGFYGSRFGSTTGYELFYQQTQQVFWNSKPIECLRISGITVFETECDVNSNPF